MVLSAAKDIKAFHSSPDRLLCLGSFISLLLCLGSFISFEESSFYSRLKITSKLAWPFGGFHTVLGLKAGVSLELHHILQENFSKSFLSPGSFKVF